MRITKRAVTTLLLTAMLASLASCGGSASGDDTTAANTPTADTTTSAEDARLALDDGLPERDFGGHVFTIWSLSPTNYYIEAETGDVVDDAKWKRQQLVEERFNVEIAVNDGAALEGKWQNLQSMIQTSVMCI